LLCFPMSNGFVNDKTSPSIVDMFLDSIHVFIPKRHPTAIANANDKVIAVNTKLSYESLVKCSENVSPSLISVIIVITT